MAYFPETNYDFPNVSNYDGDLRELLAYVKNLSNDYGRITELAEELERQYNALIADFNALKAEVENFRADIAEAVAEGVTAAMAAYEVQLNAINSRIDNVNVRVDGVNSRIDQLQALIDDFTAIAKDYTDAKIYALSQLAFEAINDLQEQIDALQWELPDVYNITRGVNTDLVTLIYDVYDAARDSALTAYEFDILGLTAKQFDDLNFTAYEFDTHAKSRLIDGKCRNPLTGELDTICNIVQALAQATTTHAITAEEFDSAELTCEEFNALNLTAYMFDYFAKQFISAA